MRGLLAVRGWAVEAGEIALSEGFRAGLRVTLMLNEVARLNPAYALAQDAVLDMVFGPAEDLWDYTPTS